MRGLRRENGSLFMIKCCAQIINFKHINLHVSKIEVSEIEVVCVFEIEVAHVAEIEVIEVKVEVDSQIFPGIHAIRTAHVQCYIWEQTDWGVISVSSVLHAKKNGRPTNMIIIITIITIEHFQE
jgi:hypothetical protein